MILFSVPPKEGTSVFHEVGIYLWTLYGECTHGETDPDSITRRITQASIGESIYHNSRLIHARVTTTI